MKKNDPYFIIELPLDVEVWQADLIDKRLECGRHLYNSLLSIVLNRYNEMIKTKRYRELYGSLTHNKKHDGTIWKQINDLERSFRLSKFDVIEDIKRMSNHFSGLMNAQICQGIAKQVWSAIKSIMHRPSKSVSFKKYGTFNSLSGSQRTRAIIFKTDFVDFGGMRLRIKYPNNSNDFEYYEKFLFPNIEKLKFCRIIRKQIRGKYRYYVHLIFTGTDVKSRYSIGSGRVGIDIGTSTVAVSSDTVVELLELAKESQVFEKEKVILHQKMDRSKRSTNPNKFNPDGTIKKGNKDKWVFSNRYKRLRSEYSDICRKQKQSREVSHNKLANDILKLGDRFFVEGMNFSGLAKRSKSKTEYVAKNKCKKKKRYGKSICNRAPSMFLSILERKLNYFGINLNRIDTKSCKASQYDHMSDTFTKKNLSDRWHIFENGTKVQRDLYSAFLISNVSDSLDVIDKWLCDINFDMFIKMHDDKIKELLDEKSSTNRKFLTSMGI